MRIVPYILMLVLITSGLTGCRLFGQQSNDKKGSGWWFTSRQKRRPQKPAPIVDPLVGSATAAPEVRGVLAGRVLHGQNGEPVHAFVRYECLDEPNSKAAPIDVKARPNGLFEIYNLKPGKRYKLTARSKVDGKTLAGVAYSTAPNEALDILVKEDFVTMDTPDVPTYRKSLDGDPLGDREKNSPPSNQVANEKRGFSVGRPSTLNQSNTLSEPPDSKWGGPPEPGAPKNYHAQVVSAEAGLSTANAKKSPPSAAFKRDNAPVTVQTKGIVTANGGPEGPLSIVQVSGKHVENFALNDFYGKAWEWRANRQGKLVLLDFWMTNCIPCLQEMDTLKSLQQKYGRHGLEILGIASERGGSYDQQRQRVIRVSNLKETRHRMLLNSGPQQQSFLEQFRVTHFPTMILLDENGNELWRHRGRMSANQVADLESFIRMKLGVR